MSAARLARSWDLIDAAQPARPGEFRVAPSEVLCSGSAVLFALDDAGHRHLLIPLEHVDDAIVDRRSGGVHLRSFALDDRGVQRPFLDVACRKRHLNEVFGMLAGEMLDALGADCRNPARSCRAVLSRWRELLDRERGDSLSLEELVGLFGELSVLRELVRRRPEALNTWTGPLGTPFDFTTGEVALETKAILGSGWKVVIHGLEQLDVPAGIILWLCVSQLQRDDTAGESIPDVVDDLVATGADRAILVGRLAKMRYVVDDRELYSGVKLRRSAVRVWPVTSDFPRITRSSFGVGGPPHAVRSVSYVLDLDVNTPEWVQDDDLGRVWERLCGSSN